MYIFPLLSSAQSISFMSVKMSEVKPTIAKALPVINSLNKNIAAVADAGELSERYSGIHIDYTNRSLKRNQQTLR